MPRLFLCTLLFTLCAVLPLSANDGRFYASGNQFLPVAETDIRLQKEVLSITLTDSGWAEIDVAYTLYNPSKAKTICVGFEAPCPTGDVSDTYHADGRHPYIDGFTIKMNSQFLSYRQAVTPAFKFEKGQGLTPIDTTRWKPEEMVSEMLYNAQLDSAISFSYTYYFEARFEEGENTINHHYRYRTDESIGYTFGIAYKLMPAMRWANRQIDDFTLMLRCPGTAKHFIVNNFEFGLGSQYQIVEGVGKTRQRIIRDGGTKRTVTEIALRNGAARYRVINFRPIDELYITSADEWSLYAYNAKGEMIQDPKVPCGFFYDRGPGKPFLLNPEGAMPRLLRNLPYAHRGYVFKDPSLRQYFNSLWWYMPDPTYKPSPADLTPFEKETLKQVVR